MTKSSVATIVEALNTAGVRYLIAGGLAVVAHGYVRFTADVDLILDLEPDNVTRAIHALEAIGYGPRVPVPLQAFADAAMREERVRERNMTGFSLSSDAHAATEIALFVEPPLDFESAYQAAARLEVVPGVEAVFVGYRDLLRLKEHAGRATNIEDIRRLKSFTRMRVSKGDPDKLLAAGWDGHERAQLRRLATLPLAESSSGSRRRTNWCDICAEAVPRPHAPRRRPAT